MDEVADRFPPKFDVVGTPISRTTFDEVLTLLANPRTDRATVIAACNVHSVMTARKDPALAIALAEADVATPDGMPLVWALNLFGHEQSERVYGPEIMRQALADTSLRLKHFFYGSTDETLEQLSGAARGFNPKIEIVGRYSPPFRDLSASESSDIVGVLRASGANVVWVGLGMPRQELWMHQVRANLPGVTLLGVGAAFDFIAGTKRQAPSWMQRSGFEWLFRLITEPRRLWRRYVWNNPAFLISVGVNWLGRQR